LYGQLTRHLFAIAKFLFFSVTSPRTVLLGLRTMGDVIWGKMSQKLTKNVHE